MSVSEVLSILHDDDFEGSTDEISISQEVFYGINSAGSERSMLKGFINFGSQEHKLVESSPFLNTGAVTSESSSKVSFLKDDDNNVHGGSPRTCASASFTEGLVHAERNDHTVPAKRMKLSIDELSGFSPLPHSALASDVLLKGTISGFEHPKTRLDSQIVVCHVVESSHEGVRSRCYQLKHGAEAEKKGCSLDTVLPKDNSLGPEGSEGKEIVVSNTMASPVSQDSCATKALVTVPAVTNVDNTGSHQRAVRKRKKGTPFELDDDDTPWTSNCTKELRPFLRRRMFHLLAAAGWSIEKRKRQCRSYEEFVFVSPQERPVRELAKAWSVCGQILHAHRYMQMEAENGRQWANIEQLCSDLYNTITNMDSELKHLEPKDAIVRQWVLLNPFVTVVFVDRKLRELRAGNMVEVKFNASDTAQKPVVVGKGKRSGGGCAKTKRCVSPVAIESTVIDFGTQSQGGKVQASTSRSIYVSEGSSLRLLETDDKVESHLGDVCINDSGPQYFPSLPACGSHITSLQPAHDLYVVPVPSGTMELVPGVSQGFSALQYDASEAVMDEPNQMYAEDAKFAQCFDSSSLRYNRADGRLASKPRGRPKKSKKVSEIKITSFSEDEMETPSGVEGDAQKMNGQANKANNKNCKRMSSSTKSCNKRTSKKKSLPCKLKDDDLLISAIVEQKKFRSNSKKGNVKAGNKIRRLKKRKNHKSGCRLLPRNLVKGSRHFPDERWTSIAKRMVLCWLLHAGVVYLNDIIQYRNLMDETVVKQGIITRDGISCRCCNKVFSMSGFNAHAGLEMNCLCLNLFMDSGQPLTLRLLEAWSAEYKARKAGLRAVQSDEFDQNDDSCGLCGDGGELLCCDKCPSTFHQSCLSAEELPEGSWYCASCTCWICGNLVDDEGSSTQCGFKCNQCEHKYHLGCLKELGVDRISSNPWFCSANCEEVHAGLNSRVALHNVIADGFSWSVLRCMQDDQNFHSAQQRALKAECNSKLAVALTVMEECFVSMVDSRTGIDMIPQVVYNWGSEFPRLDYHGFYTVVLEKDDVLISVASIRVHGVEVAEMPLVATCSKYRRKGMCRRLISAIEQMLISFKVEKLVVAAIPDLVETWTVGFGFVPVEEEEKKSLNKINLMVFPGTVLLKKTLYSGQPASLQGVGRPACNLSLVMDKSVQKWASSGAQCENKSENDECYGSEDAGLMSVKLVSPHCMEVVEAQKTSSGSTKRESLNTDRVESSGCMSLEFCGHTETNDFLDVSPHKEASETVQDMRMQVSYTDLMTAAVEPTGNAFNCRENWKSQEWTFSNEGVCHEKLQHELSFHVSSEVQNQPTPLRDNVGNYTEQGGMSFNWATEVENELAKPPVPHESADQEKAVPEANTSSATNEISTNSSHLQEGTMLYETLQANGVVPGELKIKISSITGIGEATVTAVGKAESKNDSLVLLEDEAHSIEAVQFPVTCTNGKVDDMETIKEPDTNEKLLGLICQSIDMIPHGSAASEAGKSMETQLTAEQEPQQTSSPNNSSHPCSSVALEAQNESASKSNAKLQLV